MISHCCASCGKPLDASSRVWSRDLRMWVARCPRCGHAVRWNPRGAREAFRVWARLRALNLRLGVALTAGQAAGIASLAIGGILLEKQASVIYFERVAPSARYDLVLTYGAAAIAATVLAAISAVAFAPQRPLLVRCALAWLLGALPVVATLALLPLIADTDVRVKLQSAFAHPEMLPRTIALCGAVPIASIAVTALLSPIVWAGVAPAVMRMHRVRVRAAVASTGGVV